MAWLSCEVRTGEERLPLKNEGCQKVEIGGCWCYRLHKTGQSVVCRKKYIHLHLRVDVQKTRESEFKIAKGY